MTAGPWNLVNEFMGNLGTGVYGDLTAADGVAFVLVDSTSNLGDTSTTYAALTGELATEFGYIQGGAAGTLAATGSPNTEFTLDANISWDVSGGDVTARKAAAINVSSGRIMAWALINSADADVTVPDGNPFTLYNSTPIVTLNRVAAA